MVYVVFNNYFIVLQLTCVIINTFDHIKYGQKKYTRRPIETVSAKMEHYMTVRQKR